MKCSLQSPSYLVRNVHSYCFRVIVPRDLRGFVGKTELRYTLRTGAIGTAKLKSRFLAGRVQLMFKLLRKGFQRMSKLSNDQVQQLVGSYIKKSIAELDGLYNPSIDGPDPGDDPIPLICNREDLEGYHGQLEGIRDDLVLAVNTGDFSMLEGTINAFLKENGIDEVDKQSPAYRKLCVDVHKAMIQLIPIQQQHLQCDFSYRQRLPEIFPDVFGKQQESPPTPKEKELPVHKLSQVFNEFWPNYKKKLAVRTVPENERAYNRFLDYVGREADIKSIDKETCRKYIKVLQNEKNRWGNPRSEKTINNKYLTQVSGFLKWCEGQGYIDKNPMRGMIETGKREKRPDEERSRLSNEDLKKIFCQSPEYLKDEMTKPHQFWVPLIGLFTGMRLEEICQLYVADFKQFENMWYFDLNAKREDNSIKNSERRLVPLHPFLTEDLNFVGYVQSLPDQAGRVFPELKRIGNRYSHHVSSWFSSFKKRCGIVSRKGDKAFHGLRHTVTTHLAEQDVPTLWKDILTGHAREGETEGRYTKADDVKIIFEKTVSRIKYDLDLSHLKSSKWVSR